MPGKLLLFYGEEEFLLNRELSALKEKLVPPGLETFAYQQIDGRRERFDEIIMNIQSLPTFSATRLVIIKEPYFLKSAAGQKNEEEKDKQEQLLFSSLENIPEGVTVVIAVNGSVDLRQKAAQFLKKKAEVKEFKRLASWEEDKVIGFVNGYLKEKKYTISADAAQLLIAVAGTALQNLSNELDKIIVYTGERKNITLADIKAAASQGELEAFELQDLFNRRSFADIYEVIGRMVKEGNSPIMIMGGFISQVRTMLQIKELIGQGRNQFEIAGYLKKNPYYIKQLYAGAQKYSLVELKKIFTELHQADIKIKSGQLEGRLAVELALSSVF